MPSLYVLLGAHRDIELSSSHAGQVTCPLIKLFLVVPKSRESRYQCLERSGWQLFGEHCGQVTSDTCLVLLHPKKPCVPEKLALLNGPRFTRLPESVLFEGYGLDPTFSRQDEPLQSQLRLLKPAKEMPSGAKARRRLGGQCTG
jgi:hypothetical protein